MFSLQTRIVDENGRATRPLAQYLNSISSGWPSSLAGRVTTLETDVTALEADVTTLQTDVTTLQSDVTTLETDLATLAGETVWQVTTLADLKALTTRPAVVQTMGYSSIADGGGGLWLWVSGSTTTANNGTVVQCTSGPAGRYKRIFDGPANVLWFGVKGDGSTDDSTTFLAAVNACSEVLVPYGKTVIINSVNLPTSISIEGQGSTSVIKHKDSATDHMLMQSNASSITRLYNLTLNGNYSNNGGDGKVNATKVMFRLYAGGSSSSQPTIVDIDTVTFINGSYADTGTQYTQPSGPVYWFERNTKHLGGADGGNFGVFNGAVNAFLDNILFDPQRTPTSSTAIGRAGYIYYQNNALDTKFNSVTANNIQAYRTGICETATLGAIDSYNGGEVFQITNSFSKDGFGRGFTTKADAKRMMFANVTVSGLAGNTSLATNTVNVAIGLNSGTLTTVGTDLLIDGVNIYNCQGGGICVTTPNVLATPTALFQNALVTNFVIDSIESGKPGIYVLDGCNIKISNGTIINCDTPIKIDADAVMPPYGPVTITNVDIDDTATPVFTSNAKGQSLWYARNRQGVAWSVSDLKLTVTTNEVKAWTPTVVIDTGSAAQTVTTISNVPDNEEISVQISSGSYSCTLSSGGNLSLASSVVISATSTVVKFKSVAGTLYRVDFDAASINDLQITDLWVTP